MKKLTKKKIYALQAVVTGLGRLVVLWPFAIISLVMVILMPVISIREHFDAISIMIALFFVLIFAVLGFLSIRGLIRSYKKRHLITSQAWFVGMVRLMDKGMTTDDEGKEYYYVRFSHPNLGEWITKRMDGREWHMVQVGDPAYICYVLNPERGLGQDFCWGPFPCAMYSVDLCTSGLYFDETMPAPSV